MTLGGARGCARGFIASFPCGRDGPSECSDCSYGTVERQEEVPQKCGMVKALGLSQGRARPSRKKAGGTPTYSSGAAHRGTCFWATSPSLWRGSSAWLTSRLTHQQPRFRSSFLNRYPKWPSLDRSIQLVRPSAKRASMSVGRFTARAGRGRAVQYRSEAMRMTVRLLRRVTSHPASD